LNDLGADTNDYDKRFRLMADIDLSEYTYDSAVIAVGDTTARGTGFTGTWFSGIFDGNGHKISHLTIQGEGGNCSGLFGGLGAGAQVHDLRLEAVDVNYTGSGYTGSLAGISGGDISNCSFDGRVVGTSKVGGLVGKNGYHGHGSISASFSAGEVSGYNQIGGLVGSNGARIRDCYSIASVEATGGFGVGGFVGVHNGDNIITNCYSIGRVVGGTDPWRVGGLIGANGNPIYDLKVASSFWDIESSGMTESQGGTGLSTVDMQTASTFLQAGWDFVGEDENGTEDIWTMPENDYPRLAWERTYPAPCQATVIELSNRNLDIMEQGVVLVEFYAPWCSFCQQQAPILDDVACQVSGFAKVAKVNIDTMRDVAETYGIMAIPTLIIFRDGAAIQRIVGLTQAPELVEALRDAAK
jgi:thioredoxin